MELRDWIRTDHEELRALFERSILALVPREHLTTRPDGRGNSIAWLMWHLARIEDVTINAIVRGVPQVLATGRWPEKLGVADQRIGTGFQDTEVAEFSRAVDADALDAYWRAVRKETAEWLSSVPLEVLDTVPDLDARLRSIPDIVPEDAGWLRDFWRGRPAGFFLRLSVIDHGYMHLGEMMAIRGQLGIKGR